LATVMISLGISTAALGIALFIIGRLRLASLVSYLPAPVVGGYLAFIGYFCLIAGVNLCVPDLVFTGMTAHPLFALKLLSLICTCCRRPLLLPQASLAPTFPATFPCSPPPPICCTVCRHC
jgi:hypothetical protein